MRKQLDPSRYALLAVVLVLPTLPARLRAQAAPLTPGDLVRVTACTSGAESQSRCRRSKALFREASGDSILVKMPPTTEGSESWIRGVRELEHQVVVPVRRRPLLGAALGFGIGYGTALLADWAAQNNKSNLRNHLDDLLVAGAAGAGIGALWGAGGSRAAKGALLGFGIGALPGLAVGSTCSGDCGGEVVFITAAAGGALGAMVGALVSWDKGRRWVPVPLDQLQVGVGSRGAPLLGSSGIPATCAMTDLHEGERRLGCGGGPTASFYAGYAGERGFLAGFRIRH